MEDKKELFGFSAEEVDLIRKTVGKEAVNEYEFRRFLYRASKLGLNPLDGTIHLLQRNRKKPDGTWEKTNVIIIGIDGFRAVADRSGKLCGIKRDVIYDENGRLKAAWAEVYRKDWEHPAREVVSFREYCQTKDGRPTGQWAIMPEVMLKKCAEAGAHRMAFASELAGIYIPEELQQEETEIQKAEEQKATPPEEAKEPAKTNGKTRSRGKEAPAGEQSGRKAEPPAAETKKEQKTAQNKPPQNAQEPPEETEDKTPDDSIPFEGQVIVVGIPRQDGEEIAVEVYDPVSEEQLTLKTRKADFKTEDLVDIKGTLSGKVLYAQSCIKVNGVEGRNMGKVTVEVTLAHKMFNDIIDGVETPVAWVKGKDAYGREHIILGYGEHFDPVSRLEVGQKITVFGAVEQKKGAECITVHNLEVA